MRKRTEVYIARRCAAMETALEARFRAQLVAFDSQFLHLSTIHPLRASGPRKSRWPQGEARHAQKVPTRDNVLTCSMGTFDAAVAAFEKTTRRFAPAENLFDAPSYPLAGGVCHRVEVDAHRTSTGIVRWMWNDAVIASSFAELLGAITAIGADGGDWNAAFLELFDLSDGHRRFRRTDGRLHFEENAKAVAILHRRVSGEAEPGLPAVALANELGLRIGGGFVGVVASLLAFEVAPAIAVARTARVLSLRLLLLEALQRSPGLDQSRVDREVLIGDPMLGLRKPDYLGEEQVGHLVFEQPRLVLRESRVIEDRLVRVK